MSGVEPVANYRLPEKLTLTVRRAPSLDEETTPAETQQKKTLRKPLFETLAKCRKSTALALFGSLLAFSQPSSVGHLDAAHLLGLDGPGTERWQTFLTASPAGSIHGATLHLDDARGAQLAHAGVGRIDATGVHRTAIAPATQADDLITGSIPDARLPEGIDPLVARDIRAHRMLTPAVHALVESRRRSVSLYDSHPFAQIELASLPTRGFDGFVGLIPPPPEMIIAQSDDDAGDFDAFGTPGENVASDYAMALVDPAAATSPLSDTQGQQQISAFLNNDRQFQCLAEGIYFEARGETRRGQVAVAQVIMNRVNHHEFPDTICGVVYQNQHWRNRCQFSFACDGVPERITERAAWDIAEDVSRQVLEGRDLIDTIEDSTHYHANYVRPRWAPRMIRLDRVGLHIFYKGRYGGWR